MQVASPKLDARQSRIQTECEGLAGPSVLESRLNFCRLAALSYLPPVLQDDILYGWKPDGLIVSSVDHFEDKGIGGFIARLSDDESVLSFRGTDLDAGLKTAIRDFVSDGEARQVHVGDTYVHEGFLDALGLCWPQIQKATVGRRLWIVGHSLGGALALLCAIRLAPRLQALYTFGCPRVGDKAFAEQADSLFLLAHNRYVRPSDPIPHLPPAHLFNRPYYHCGTLTTLDGLPLGHVKAMLARWFGNYDLHTHEVTGYCEAIKRRDETVRQVRDTAA